MELINAIGRRKSAVARVYLKEGTGKITINKKDLTEFFPSAILQYVVKQPLQLLEAEGKYDIKANLDGGGFTGQSQALRLAIARALVNEPHIIMADEPTGNLDTKSTKEIMDIFERMHERGHTIILVTHEPEIAVRASRQLLVRDGRITRDEGKGVVMDVV